MKTLSIYSPNTFLNAMCDLNHFDLDRYFGSFIEDSFYTPSAKTFSQMPAVDIQEKENLYLLAMELPGFDEKNIDVQVDGSNLTISSRHEEEKKSEDNHNSYILRERRQNSFTRSFKLPENADPGTVNASFKNGILNLEVKKRADAQKRTIQINAA